MHVPTVYVSYGHYDVGKAADLGLGLRVGAKYFGTRMVTNVAIEKWYKRDEGNGWRPIAASKMNEFEAPPWLRSNVVCSSLRKFGLFHFSKLRRKIDMETQKKQRRRIWMMKAYRIATANRGPAYTERAGAVEDGEDCQDRIPRDEVPSVGRSTGSVKNRADADTVRLSNNWCSNGGSKYNSYDDEREDLCEEWRGHHSTSLSGRRGTRDGFYGMRFKIVPRSEQSTRSVVRECARNDCEEDSEMLKWR